jgi:hypothetical protein
LSPLDECGVGFPEQPKGLAGIPAVEIDVIDDGVLDDIASLFQIDSLIPRRLMHIDEANIVVAVRRSKTPGSASGFNGEQNAHAVFTLGFPEAFQYFGADFV